MRISEFTLLDYSPPDLKYLCRVSKGTYIRSLSEHIAQCLGTVGYTVALRREAIGNIEVGEARVLDDLSPDNFESAFYPVRKLFTGFEFLCPEDEDLASLRRGQTVANAGAESDRILLLDADDSILGLVKRESGILFPVMNFLG